MIKPKVLFIGNFLSAHRGTIGPMEGVMRRMEKGIIIKKASTYDNKILKIADIFFKSLFASYDIIHIDTYSSKALYFAWLAANIAKIRNKKVILNLRGGGLFNLYQNDYNKQKFIKRLFSKANEIVTPSLYLQDMFQQEEFVIQYLPNTVDKMKFPFQNKPVNNHKLLWVRAFNATYQPWLAVRILSEIKKTHPDTTLTMIGPDKGLLAETKDLINRLKLGDSVEIVGKVPNTELWKYYTTHQVFLNTTNKESFGVAVMEAASCGIPIVTSAVGELSYLWQHNENAMVVDSFDESEFAKNVQLLFEDDAFYLKVRQKARMKASNFSWESVKLKWIDIFKL